MNPYYIISALVILIVAILLWQWRHQRLLALRARLMREALRNRDFTFRLPTDRLLPGERELQSTLNDMGSEINRLLARNEVESWQRLTRVLTHEIMNAVAPIQSITQAYIGSPLVKDTPLEEGMRAIYDTSLGLSTFVDIYRKLTQLQPADIKSINLPQFINTIKTLYPEVEWHINLSGVITVDTDHGMFRQVITNIVKNAIEAEAHTIDISISNNGSSHADGHKNNIRLLISNDGQLISPEESREIFIPFFTTKETGQGIGLSLARQMMIACRGNLWLADRPVVGYHTTFIVEL